MAFLGVPTKVESYHFYKLTRYNFWYILIVAEREQIVVGNSL